MALNCDSTLTSYRIITNKKFKVENLLSIKVVQNELLKNIKLN